METEDMQTMNSTTNQLLTETYTSLCPIIIHYINRKINDYESARDMAQDVFLRLMEYKQILRKETLKLLQLSPQRRTVYIMSRFQGKTAPEISEELCLSRRTIENHLLASRKEIREYIKSCI